MPKILKQMFYTIKLTLVMMNTFESLHEKTWPRGYNFFFMLNSTEQEIQLLIKTKIPTSKECFALSLSYVVFIILITVKMPTIVGILTFMSS